MNKTREYGVTAFDASVQMMNVTRAAIADGNSGLRLIYIKTDQCVAAQGPRVVAECALRWAHEVLNDAKAAGTYTDEFKPIDVLLCAAIAMSDSVNPINL